MKVQPIRHSPSAGRAEGVRSRIVDGSLQHPGATSVPCQTLANPNADTSTAGSSTRSQAGIAVVGAER